jgi:membrane-bound lytic murein transglycosylase B
MSREAAAAGISRTVIDSAFAGLTQDGAVLAFDRRQRGTFRKSFEEYAATRVVPAPRFAELPFVAPHYKRR